MLTAAIVAGVVLVLIVAGYKPAKRVSAAVGAQINKFSRWVWRVDPIAMYQAEVDKSAEEIQEAREGLEQFKGHVTLLQRKVTNGEKKVEDLKLTIRGLLQQGNENRAANYALELQSALTQLQKDKEKLSEQEVIYKTNLKKMQYANQRVRDAKEKAEKMQSDLRFSKVEAEMAKLGHNFEIRTSSIDNLGEIEDEIQRQIDANRAKGQVSCDLGHHGLEIMEEKEKLQQQEAMNLLEQFKQELLPGPKVEVKILPPIDQHERN